MDTPTTRILELISEKGINNHRLEMTSGLSNGTINNWINGKSKASVDALIKIADYFDVSVDYLLGKTDDKQRKPGPDPSSANISVPKEYADVVVAFAGGVKDLSQEDIDSVIEFIEFKKNKAKK